MKNIDSSIVIKISAAWGDKLKAFLLFLIFSCGLLLSWNYLIHHYDDVAGLTLQGSIALYTLIIMSALLILSQKRMFILKDLINISIGLISIFSYTAVIFNILLNIIPDVNDFEFYYGFFILVYFSVLPIYLCIRITIL